jgi:hypothetical protein
MLPVDNTVVIGFVVAVVDVDVVVVVVDVDVGGCNDELFVNDDYYNTIYWSIIISLPITLKQFTSNPNAPAAGIKTF